MEGTVTSISSVLCEVDAGQRTYTCKVRGRLAESDTGESKPMAVGDRVAFSPIDEDEGIIEKVLPRSTKLSRRSPRDPRTEHVIVANVEQLLIVASVRKPPLTAGIIDRYIIAGEAGGLDPVICINKVDLAADESEYRDLARMYEEMEYLVLLTSATERRGLEGLKDALRDASTVLAGHSGVGKSSLINAIEPGLKLRTGPVRTKGRHVTSRVSLLKLSFGGYVVDTPGIREFTLWEIEKGEVAQFFPWIWEMSHECRMPDCVHMHEPDCAVKAALERGELPRTRYDSYVRIVETIEEITVPRDTDVEQPEEQIARHKREPSRRRRKQQLRRLAREQLEEAEEDLD
ncbi:MAG: ribosome small subunit-dependent GTPase A [Planctomycetota bacterium]|jgi:ribosome biogenesis GTPase